jgi:chitinase
MYCRRYEGANFDYMFKTVTHLVLFSLEPMKNGGIGSLDRIPRDIILTEAMQAAKKHGTKVMICFGGNGRSEGFSRMVRNSKARTNFVQNLVNISKTYGFDGVDYK